MKAISLWQPWASAIRLGVKTMETRNWKTKHVGPIAIHAAAYYSTEQRWIFESLMGLECIRKPFDAAVESNYDALPRGMVIATATLVECVPTKTIRESKYADRLTKVEQLLGDYSPGRYAWILTDVKKLHWGIKVRAKPGFFEVNL